MHQDFALTDLKDENTSGLHTASDTRIAAYAKRIDGADPSSFAVRRFDSSTTHFLNSRVTHCAYFEQYENLRAAQQDNA